MHLCYVDESGTPELPGTSTHFVLAGLSLPIAEWKRADASLSAILKRYALEGQEVHTAWILRKYLEQSRIDGFESMDWPSRRSAVTRFRAAHLLNLQKKQQSAAYRQAKKNYRHTDAYIHLTYAERSALILEIATEVSAWTQARLFAECINKIHFDPTKSMSSIGEQAFEQIVSRFEQYLENTGGTDDEGAQNNYGLIIHDNNETVAHRYTALMRKFHERGTLWTGIKRIIETPLFVDSRLTGMVQIADLCSYALRRYLEEGEEILFNLIFKRADRVGTKVLGVRHFSDQTCGCTICKCHRVKRPIQKSFPKSAGFPEMDQTPSES